MGGEEPPNRPSAAVEPARRLILAMAKLVIQIPCHNERETLPLVLATLPRALPGLDDIEWLVVDDGSRDGTAEVAIAGGVNHIVRLPQRQGLASAFLAGLEGSLKAGADIIVNTDADNQYCADDIPKLVAPILAGEAEIVIGARPIATTRHFSPVKKLLQGLGSWATRVLSNTEVRDAPSGFRAMSREAALRLHVFNGYTYTIETVIQAGRKGMAVRSVPIRTNPELRPSRLVRGLTSYVARQVITMARVFMTYLPLRFFAIPGAFLFALGLALGLRFVYYYVTAGGVGHVQSLILAALLMGTGFFLGVVGLVADLIGVNRNLLEQVDWRVKKLEEVLTGQARTAREEHEASLTGPSWRPGSRR
jgi:glycosyltransferase involved in cell wall biosynthesis